MDLVPECPTCKRTFEDTVQPLTTLSFSVSVKVAPGAVLLRSHVVDQVQEALLDWMHSDVYESIESDGVEPILDVVIAR